MERMAGCRRERVAILSSHGLFKVLRQGSDRTSKFDPVDFDTRLASFDDKLPRNRLGLRGYQIGSGSRGAPE